MPMKVLGELCRGLELDIMQTYPGVFMSQELLCCIFLFFYFFVEGADPCRLRKQQRLFRGREEEEVAGLQRSEIKPIACSEKRK